MDTKTWPWSKYNKTKTLKALKEETEKSQELERSLRYLNEKLTAVLDESNAKDNLLEKQEKVAEEALAGWEKAEENAASLKRELDDALQQTVSAEERLLDLDHSLKECMQQLRDVQQEREKMIDDVAAKTLREKEKAHILEAKLAEAKQMIAKLVADSDSLNVVLEAKEEMINDLNDAKIREEEKCKDIMAKLDSSGKQNASLKYELYMLEKELQIRNEEKDFNLKSVKTAHKQHLLSVKKIAELEEECNKLRVMLRKRLPGPAALVKMKSEVEMLGVDSSEAQKKKLNSKKNGTVPSSDAVISRSSGKDALTERMREIEEENKILRKELRKKNSELQSSRIMCAHTASKLSHVESQLEGLSNTIAPDAERTNQLSCEIHASNSENGGNDDVMSSAESWASVLTTELGHLKVGKPETSPALRGVLDTSLMDDFVEMEKLAVITSGTAHEKSFKPTGEYPVDVPGSSDLNGHTVRSHVSNRSSSCQFKDILIHILQRHHVDQEKVDAILEETRIALTNISRSVSCDFATPTNASPEICCKSQDACSISFRELDCISLSSSEPTTQQFPTNLDKAICELIEVVEDIKEKSLSGNVDDKAILENDKSTHLPKESLVHTECVTRVFRWKSLELKEVLDGYLHVCNALLHGHIGLRKFIREITSTMNWVVQHAFTADEVSTLNPKEAHRQSELSLAMTVPYEEVETDRSSVPDQVKFTIETPLLAPDFAACCKRNAGSNAKNEKKEGDNTEYQITQHSKASKEHATDHFQDASEKTLGLQIELERLKEAKGLMGHHLDSRKACDAHLSSRIAAAKTDLREAVQHFPSLKKAFEDQGNGFEDSRSAYPDLPVQPESASTDDKSNVSTDQEQQQQLRTNWDISVASEKLVECQETILNIEKQLKALAVSGDTALHHSTLCDQLLADDSIKPAGLNSGAAKEKTRSDTQLAVRKISSSDKVGLLYGMKLPTTHNTINQLIANSSPTVHTKSPMKLDARSGVDSKRGMSDVGSALAIVPRKQRPQVSFWRRLLRRRNKDSGRKMMMMMRV